jgi:hypothetical protein
MGGDESRLVADPDRDKKRGGTGGLWSSMFATGGLTALMPSGCLCCAANLACAVHQAVSTRMSFVSDGAELRWAVSTNDKALILKLLERNAKPEKMAQLHRDYGASMVGDLRSKLSAEQWARARAYLGAEVPFDVRVETHDKDSIVRDIDNLTDADALALFATPPSGGISWMPNRSMFDRVQSNLQGRWFGTDNEAYYTVLGKLIDKAQRGLTADRGAEPLRALVASVFGFEAPEQYPIDAEGLDPVARARVDLAVSRIVYIAGTSYNTRLGPAAVNVALAGLTLDEVNAVATGVAHETSGTLQILGDRAIPDLSQDVAGIRDAIEAEGKEAAAHGRPVDAAGVATALTRAADMIRDTRLRRDKLIAEAQNRQAALDAGEAVPAESFDPNAATSLATTENHLKFLTETFFKGPLSEDYKRALKGSGDSYAEGLRAMGADPLTVGLAIMEDAWEPQSVSASGSPAPLAGVSSIGSFSGRLMAMRNPFVVIERLKKIEPEYRLDVMVKSGLLAKLARWPLTAETRDLLRAYIWEGRSGEDAKLLLPDPIAPDLPREPAQIPAGFDPFPDTPGGPTAKSIIALNDVLDGMDKGPKQAAFVLARLQRLTKDERTALFGNPRFKAKLEAMPEGDDKSEKRDFKDALRRASTGDVEGAILHYPGPAGPWQSVAMEEVRVRAERIGHARLRRALVLKQRITEDPTAATRLSAMDKYLIDDLDKLRLLNPLFDNDQQRQSLDEVAFGQPQLIDTPEAALDPNIEAEYMRARLRAAVGIKPGQRLTDWSHKGESGPLIEALTEFELLYEQQRPGGFSKDALPALADSYYRGLDAYHKWKADFDRNRSQAAILASVVAMVVAAVVITVASGGTLGLPAITALAALGGGAGHAVTGALLRYESSAGDIARDFGTGAVEGALAVAGEALAAKIIARAARTMTAGRAAVEAGAAAAGKATHGVGGSIVKSALEGAIGGAGGELFQTAIDEATWDRGITHAFAKMLAAIGRGALIGATLGGTLAGSFAGAAVLRRVYKQAGGAKGIAGRLTQWLQAGRVGPEMLEKLSDEALEQLVHATKLIEQGNLKEAERVISRIEGLAGGSRRALRAAARARVAASTVADIGAADLAGTSLFPDILSDSDFKKLAKLRGDQQRDAMIIIENGQPRIVMREGAPPQALREEMVHLQQWNMDIAQRSRMRNLSEETFKKETWDALPAVRKLELHIDKLEVEADAQRRIIDQLSGRPEHDVAAARQIGDADEALYHIEEKLERLRAARTKGDSAIKALDVDEVPRLYAAGPQTTHTPSGTSPFEGLDLNDANDVAKLRKAGYKVTPPTASRAGRIARSTKQKNNLLQLRVGPDGKTQKVTTVRAGFQEELARAPGRWQSEETALAGLKHQLDNGLLPPHEAIQARIRLERGAQFRAALQSRVNSLQHPMDAATAGLLMKWGPVVDHLASTFPDVSIDALLANISKIAKKGEADAFRRMLRKEIADRVLGVVEPENRVKALLDMIEIQPDSASRGHLFGEFRQRLQTADPKGVLKPANEKPPPFYEKGFASTRQPDDVIDVAAGTDIPAGTWLGEDKAGQGAFKIEQLEDLVKLWDPQLGGFKRAAKDANVAYKGEIFFFSEEQWAKNAHADILNNSATKPLLDADPPGVILMYLDPKTGQFRQFKAVAAPSAGAPTKLGL